VEFRAASDGGMPTLHGHFAVFNRFTEIDSWFEGHFMERIAPGAFRKTFKEQNPKVLFQHGSDPQIGDKPLGSIESLSEDATGAAYEVRLLDTAYVRELIPGLEAGLYGASFRFKVMREELMETPKPSDDNPLGLPERTIKEAQVMEFGPVTFPAYSDASAGVRSLTDRFLFDAIERDPTRARDLLTVGATELVSVRLDPELHGARMDPEDIGHLAEMIMCATEYIAAQDPAIEQTQITQMEDVIAALHDLEHYEVTEDESMEPPDAEGMASKPTDAATSRTPGRKPGAAAPSTSGEPTPKTWPHVSQEEWEQMLWNRAV